MNFVFQLDQVGPGDVLFAVRDGVEDAAGSPGRHHDEPRRSLDATSRRNLTAFDDGALTGKKYLLLDRDTKFCEGFRGIIESAGTECVLLPPRSPNLNANIERFMRSIKEESLSRIIFFGEASLRKAVNQYLEHYHLERNQQGLDNKLIAPGEASTFHTDDLFARRPPPTPDSNPT